MKRWNKIMSSMLAASVAAMALAGCGSSSGSSTTATSSAAAATEAAASTTEAASSDTAASGETFKIGVIGPLTGGAAQYGNGVANAAKIAVDEVNADGGINGYQVELQSEDDALDNQQSVNCYNTLKDWGMQFLLGSVTSACSIAVSEETHNDNMFQLTPSGSAVDCVKYDNAFRVCFSDPNQGTKSAQYIGEHKLATNVAIIYDSSDVYSSGITNTFVTEAANQGLNIVSQTAFTADSKTDFSSQVQQAKDAGEHLGVLPSYYAAGALLLQKADSIDYLPTVFG